MARSLSQNRTWVMSHDTLQIRKNIIARARSQRNCEGSLTATGCIGRTRKAVKTATGPEVAQITGLKAGVNKKASTGKPPLSLTPAFKPVLSARTRHKPVSTAYDDLNEFDYALRALSHCKAKRATSR